MNSTHFLYVVKALMGIFTSQLPLQAFSSMRWAPSTMVCSRHPQPRLSLELEGRLLTPLGTAMETSLWEVPPSQRMQLTDSSIFRHAPVPQPHSPADFR